jgi:hypothetical protein
LPVWLKQVIFRIKDACNLSDYDWILQKSALSHQKSLNHQKSRSYKQYRGWVFPIHPQAVLDADKAELNCDEHVVGRSTSPHNAWNRRHALLRRLQI